MWRYALFDFDPQGGQTFDEWRRKMAEDGWQLWSIDGRRSGAWINVEGQRLWRLSLRFWKGPGVRPTMPNSATGTDTAPDKLPPQEPPPREGDRLQEPQQP